MYIRIHNKSYAENAGPHICIFIFKGLRPAADPWKNQKVSKSLRSWLAVFCIHVRLCIRILAWSNADRWVVNSCNIWLVWFSFAWYSATYLFVGRWPVTCKCNRSSLMFLKVPFYSVWFSMVLIHFIWFSLFFCDFPWVSWLPGHPGGPGGPSESSEGSWELPG